MQFALTILKDARVKKKYIDTLSTPASLSYFATAFTDPSYDENNNYLFLRALGTVSLHKTLVWYLVKKFPHVNQKTLTQIKINLLRDSEIGKFVETLGIADHILHDPKMKKTVKLSQNVFEAIIGAIEFLINSNYKMGIGNVVVTKLCSYVLDQLQIVADESLLENFKTKLKELYFDRNKMTHELQTVHTKDADNIFHVELYDVHLGRHEKIGEGAGNTIINGEQEASEKALLFLTQRGLIKDVQRKKVVVARVGPVHKGKRGVQMTTFILNLLRQRVPLVADLKLEKGIEGFEKAFTHPDVNADFNYELYETLGDNTLNKCVLWYISNRFPQLNMPDGVDLLTKLKIRIIQTNSFGRFAEELGFYDYVSCMADLGARQRQEVMEDVFESFFAATEMAVDDHYKPGMGFIVCYKLLASILEQEEIGISYDDLVDPKTQLKELFDSYKTIKLKYNRVKRVAGQDEFYTSTISESKLIGDVFGPYRQIPRFGKEGYTEQEADQNISREVIGYYREMGIIKPIPKEYLKFCV